MSPEDTGIVMENNYDDPRMWGSRHRQFLYGSLGTGVAVGDYDGDGRPDIFIVSKTEGHRLFRNLGNWRFEDVTVRAGVEAPPDHEWEQGASWADVNNDGLLDLYVCRFARPNLLFVNQGDGTFSEEAAAAGLAVSDASSMAAFCDYDRDGWLDLYLLTNVLGPNDDAGRPDLLFHNNGDGTFSDVTNASGIGQLPFQGHAAIWWDYDEDGWPDLYVTTDYSPPDIIYHNERNGTFSVDGNRAVPHTPFSSMGGDIGDLDGDGRIDLFIADMEPTTHEKDQRNTAETRRQLDDPFLDPLVVVQRPKSALYLNTGMGRCLEAAEMAGLAATDWTWSARCVDLDCDGLLDMHFTNGMNREQTNVDLVARISAAISLAQRIRLMKSTPVLKESNFAYRNHGDLRFEDVSRAWGLDQAGVSFGAAFGDFDGDGDLDLVFTNYNAPPTVLRNDADQGHRLIIALRGTASNRSGIGAVVRVETRSGTQVRTLQLARGYGSNSEPVVHFGLGEATSVDTATITWPSGRVQKLTGLAVDRRYVIVEPEASDESALPVEPPAPQFEEVAQYAGLEYGAREAAFDETAIQPLLPRYLNHCGPALAVGDLDGDGVDDLCFGGTTRDSPRTLIADGRGYYHDISGLAPYGNQAVNDGPILIFDVDGDDANDILITSGGVAAAAGSANYQPRLLLNQGGGFFLPADPDALPLFHQPVGAACAADFDRDGKLDVFLGGRVVPGRYPEPARAALLHNRGGRFEDVTSTVAPDLSSIGLVTSALWSDVDGDGWVDLLVTLEWGGIRFFHNANGAHLEDRSAKAGFSSAGNGWWTSLAAADFNGDGQPDYVAGNAGLNTPYRASPEQPTLIFRGVFDDSVPPLSIEGYYQHDQLWPRVARGELGAFLPSVLRRFPGTDDYAHATLEELLDPARLAAAQRYAATELHSGVFLSQPNGHFQFSPLPRTSQIAPLRGMIAGDFDGDGFADIVAVQNDDDRSARVGRFDGGVGQFLRGNGHGGFEPAPPRTSGIVVPGDARAAVAMDFDGDAWPDFVVSRSRSMSMAWHNRGRSDARSLQVRLEGPRGNRNAIGARVTAEYSTGGTQTLDVVCGGGVLSQGSASCFFGNPPGNPLIRVRVRWPSGRESTEKVDASAKRMVIPVPPTNDRP